MRPAWPPVLPGQPTATPRSWDASQVRANAHCSRLLTFSTIERMPSMRSPVLIGRGPELHALVSALDRAQAGACGALLLTGDPGVGQSRPATEISSPASAA